jgi:hypothetical protein
MTENSSNNQYFKIWLLMLKNVEIPPSPNPNIISNNIDKIILKYKHRDGTIIDKKVDKRIMSLKVHHRHRIEALQTSLSLLIPLHSCLD